MWFAHSLGQGVVLTRQKTALQDGELQSSQFVRMLPGNREQLYPDTGYDNILLNIPESQTPKDCFKMNFDGGHDYFVVVCDHFDEAVAGVGQVYIFDLNNLDHDARFGLSPLEFPRIKFASGLKSSSNTNRGAEYFLNIASVIPGTEVKIAEENIFYINDSNTLAARVSGLAPSTITIQTARSQPVLANTLWDRTDQQSGAPQYDIGNAYTANIAVYNHLYGSWAALEEEWETEQDRVNAFAPGFSALRAVGTPFIEKNDVTFNTQKIVKDLARHWVPASKISLRLPGQGYVFAYWCTEFDETFGVESGPSDIGTVVSGNSEGAYWEVEIDWEAFLDDDNPYLAHWRAFAIDNFDRYEIVYPFLSVSRESVIDDLIRQMRNSHTSGVLERNTIGSFPLTEAQKEALLTRIDLSGGANSRTEQVYLYRQNMGIFNDYLLEWLPGVLSPALSEPIGEGARNADDLIAGRINRQGGLLKVIEIADLGDTVEDNTRASGVSDPGLAFPTIKYVTRGGLGVFEYLRQTPGASAACNMAQSLLRVEHSFLPDTLGQNIISVAPVDAPEQAPIIYSIPLVTEKQDEVITLVALRDTALVFMTTSTLHLNFIPFDGSNQQDRVITQLSGSHGMKTHRRGAIVDTQFGQIYVWLSQTSLMATNGQGAWDICADFSVDAAERLGYNFDNAVLVNNVKEHRLELWSGGTRWDFLYHRSQMKDIRGDGSGLALKLMGPTPWYEDGFVACADNGSLGGKHRTFHIFTAEGGGKVLAISNDDVVSQQARVVTRKIWGSNPTSRLHSNRGGTQHDEDVRTIRLEVVNSAPATHGEGEGSVDLALLRLDKPAGFSDRFIEDGLGGSSIFGLDFVGGAVGPLWVQTQETPGGTGR